MSKRPDPDHLTLYDWLGCIGVLVLAAYVTHGIGVLIR